MRVDPKDFNQIDPLAVFMDPLLKPVAKAVKVDLVVSLPDFFIAMLSGELGTVESVLKGFSQVKATGR